MRAGPTHGKMLAFKFDIVYLVTSFNNKEIKMLLDTIKQMTICTTHLPYETMRSLGDLKPKDGVFDSEYGVLINIAVFSEGQEYNFKEAIKCEFLSNIIELAVKRDCKYLELDRDVEPTIELERFSW